MAVDALARAIAAGKTPVTAYEEAVKAGYTGTEEQFAQDMGNSGTNAANAAASASAAAASAESVSASAAQIATNTSDISDLKESLTQEGSISRYLYKEGYYINASGVETANADYNIYKIPVTMGDLVTIKVSENSDYWGTLNVGVVHQFQLSDNSFSQIPTTAGSAVGIFGTSARKVVAVAPALSEYICLSILKTSESNIIVLINNSGEYVYDRIKLTRRNVISKSSVLSDFVSEYYPRVDKTFRKLAGYSVYPVAVKAGDVVNSENLPSGLTFYGTFVSANDLSVVQIQNTFKASTNGIAFLFDDYSITPFDAIEAADLQFKGVSGVAFGTSLTYRAQTNYGYLQYLPQLSGIDFENQGVGGSGITTGTLTAIQNYNSYASKRIVLIEGFINDWYNGAALGTYTDTTTETACGCLRTAINYIMAQNANIEIFIVFDHYGKINNGADCSSTGKNNNNLTQYEYYEELAKVAESLGIPAIKLYSTSGISENTPQYLTDNIHPTKLGARQTAYCIWYDMKKYPINQI